MGEAGKYNKHLTSLSVVKAGQLIFEMLRRLEVRLGQLGVYLLVRQSDNQPLSVAIGCTTCWPQDDGQQVTCRQIN